jgi:maleylacetate reductase
MAEQGPLRFAFDSPAIRVRFGAGCVRELPAELDALGFARLLLITTPGRARDVRAMRALLGPRLAETFAQALPHVPAELVRRALEVTAAARPDACLVFGGGSAVGLGKAVARETGLPLVAVPTTYAGSEMTSIWGISDEGGKRTGRDARALPRLVLYDAELTLDLPPAISAASGMNAMAHAVEAMYAAGAGPEVVILAEDAIRRLRDALPRIIREPRNVDARDQALAGAHLAGRSLEKAAMGLHHKLCHVLGGSFGLPHAETHAALLPYVVAFNAAAAPEAMARIAAALGAPDAVTALLSLSQSIGTARPLAELGLTAEQVPRAAALACAGSYPNPRAVTEPDVAALLERARTGAAP